MNTSHNNNHPCTDLHTHDHPNPNVIHHHADGVIHSFIDVEPMIEPVTPTTEPEPVTPTTEPEPDRVP